MGAPFYAELGSLGSMPTVHVPLWRSPMFCFRMKRQGDGECIAATWGNARQVVVLQTSRSTLSSLWRSSTHQQHVWLLPSVLRQSTARNHGIVIHWGCSDPGSSSYKGSCQCNPRLCISAEVCPVLYDRRGYTGRCLFSNTSCIWTRGSCFIRDSVCLADAGIELQCTPAV